MAPQFTVIVPTYKGGEYLKQCVRSVLAQTHTNFELAVLENGNVDGSVEWLHSMGDSRLKVYPSATVLSIEHNWARALEVPKNEFITFFGHDDLMDPNYLEVMHHLICEHPNAGLYHAHFRFISHDGGVLGPCRPMPARESASEFLRAHLHFERDANGTGYVMRSRDFERVGGFPRFHKMLYADHALWLNLVYNSFIVTAPHECFSYRLHRVSTSGSAHWRDHLQALQQLIAFFDHGRRWGAEVERLFQEYAPNFFLRLCTDWYTSATVEANRRNRRVEPWVLEAFATTFGQVAPQGAEQFRNLKSVRLRRIINAYWPMRMAYILYIIIRYGRSELHSGA